MGNARTKKTAPRPNSASKDSVRPAKGHTDQTVTYKHTTYRRGWPEPTLEPADLGPRGNWKTPVTPSVARPVPTFNWDEIEALRRVPKLPCSNSEGFTVAEYTAKFGISESGARREIKKMLAAGTIQAVGYKWVMSTGGPRRGTCYAKVDAPTPPAAVRRHGSRS